MNWLIRSAILLTAAASMASARNAAELKADLAAVMPAGVTAIRVAYIKSTDGFQEFAMFTKNTVVWVASSEDGTPRKLYPASGSGNYFNVNITSDGKRVFFWDAGRKQLVVVNWDGSNPRTATLSGTVTEYWRGDGKDWAVINTGSSAVNRVNIDAVTEVVRITTTVGIQTAPVSISDDGKRLLIQGDGAFGLWNVDAGQYVKGPNGCQPSLRAGNSYQWNLNPSGHHSMQVINPNGTVFSKYETAVAANQYLTTKGLTGSCQSGDGLTQEGTRYTQHPDFVTFFISNSKANPILSRLPDMKSVYIEDGLACNFVGDMDAVFLGGPTGVAGRKTPSNRPLTVGNRGSDQSMFSFSGRRTNPAKLRGIGVWAGQDGTVARKAAVLR